MVQFKILSGKMAGSELAARHFPFRCGRSPDSDLCSEEPGVWDNHLEISFDKQKGFSCRVLAGALASLNGANVQTAVLRNGDIIELGALKLQFWLGETRQSGLKIREWLTWTGLLLIAAVEIMLIYRLGL